MNKISRIVEWILSLPKSFYVSWSLTSFREAFRLPIRCRYDTIIDRLKGHFIGDGVLYLGFDYTGLFRHRSILIIEGTLVVNGQVRIGGESKICVMENGNLVFKGDVTNSAGLTIICGDEVVIGGGTVISWDTTIIDSDFHYIEEIETQKKRRNHSPINIEDNVWLCMGVTVLKGSYIKEHTIVGANAQVLSMYSDKECIIASAPPSVIKRGVRFINE